MSFNRAFSTTANAVAHAAGMPVTFLACCAIVVVWAVSGPVFGFSDTWQLIINTGTTIITFLMVFLIQNTQNRDGAALQLKLDELIRAMKGAQNSVMSLEDMTEEELERLKAHYYQLAGQPQEDEEEESPVDQAAPPRPGGS